MKDTWKTPRSKKTVRPRRALAAKVGNATERAIEKVVKQIAAKEATREMETKFVANGQNSLSFNSPILGAEIYSLIPPVVQNPSTNNDWERIGNDVTPMSCVTDFHVQIAPRARTMNIKVFLYLMQSKTIREFRTLAAQYASFGPKFLRRGDSAQVQGFAGYIVDGDLPVLTENFTLLKKYTFQLATNVGLPNGDATPGNAPNVSTQSYKHIRYSYKCPKQFRYDPVILDPAGDYPIGHAPFWCLGYAHADGTAPDLSNTDVVVSYSTKMTYKDS